MNQTHRFCIAPMMKRTDRHGRFFLRTMTRCARLYTEMISARAVIHGNTARLLAFDPSEHPVALQLGGGDPQTLARAARLGAEAGFDEINLNVGCPSKHAGSGRFGACLMRDPGLVADAVAQMSAASAAPVTVKCRIGVDDQDPEQTLPAFVDTVAAAGCGVFIIHARKAWLRGVNPKANRTLPPLDYPLVHALKRRRPDLTICLNGGIGSLADAARHLAHVDGVMLGRAPWRVPWMLADVDRELFAVPGPGPDRAGVLARLLPYVRAQVRAGVSLHVLAGRLMGLGRGGPGAGAFRRHLALHARSPDAGVEVLHAALALASGEQRRGGLQPGPVVPAAQMSGAGA